MSYHNFFLTITLWFSGQISCSFRPITPKIPERSIAPAIHTPLDQVTSNTDLQNIIVCYLGNADWIAKRKLTLNSNILSVAYTLNDSYVMLGLSDGTIKLYNTQQDGCHLKNIQFNDKSPKRQINQLISAESPIMLSTTSSGGIKQWDCTDLNELTCKATQQTNARRIAYCSATQETALSILNARNHEIIICPDPNDLKRSTTRLPGHQYFINCLTYSPDGKYLASATWSDIKIWDVAAKKCMYSFTFGTQGDTLKWISPTQLLMAIQDSNLGLWDFQDIQKPVQQQIYAGHTAAVINIGYEPNTNYFVSGSYDSTIKFWDIPSGQCMSTCQFATPDSEICEVQLAFSQGGKYLAVASFENLTIRENPTATFMAVVKAREEQRRSPSPSIKNK